MIPSRILGAGLAVAILLAGSGVSAQQVQVESYMLDNGMEFLLLPRYEQPNSIMAAWVARVGSVNETPGMTGISHFFEHMMFKGTNTIGTRDPQGDARLRRSQETVRAQLRKLHLTEQYDRWKAGKIDDPWNPSNDTAEMAELREELRSLMKEQGQITVKNEFDRIYSNMGGTRMNAFTSHDLTFYFINVPSNKFELWAWMESDRLVDSVFREFYEERDVVHEERRMRTESTPTGIFQEQFDAMFWQSSPYSWPVIGWTSDLNSYTRAQAESYYETYYAPNNLVGVIVGDFQPDEVRPLIKKYFGRLKRGKDAPPVVTMEMKQLAEKVMKAECDCPPQVEVRYHTVPFDHPDEFAFEVMSQVLNGRTGRLYKAMVEGSEIAASAGVGQDSRKYAGAFSFSGQCKGDATPEQLVEAWDAEVEKLRSEPVTERELQKVKNQMLADSYRRLQDNFFLMLQVGYYEALGGWEYINTSPAKLNEVTADDIMEVANRYFDETNRSIALYTRKGGAIATPMDPEMEALSPEQQAQAKQILNHIKGQRNVQQLQAMRAQMEGAVSQAPADQRAFVEYLMRKIDEQIATLEAEE